MSLFAEIDRQPSRRKLLEFGLVLLFFASAAGAWAWHKGHPRTGVILVASGAAMLVTALVPVVGRLAYIGWMALGLALGRVTSPVILLLVYGLVVVPIGVAMRLRGRDTLHRKLERGATTYWEDYPRGEGVSSYLRQS